MSSRTGAGGRDLLQTAALLVGVVFVLVAILGFIPGVTTDYDSLGAAGHESKAKLLGLFQVSILHNIVHLLFGVGIFMSRTRAGAKAFLVGGGVVYFVLVLVGLFIANKEEAINFVPINTADNYLHLGLGIGMVALGLLLGRSTTAART